MKKRLFVNLPVILLVAITFGLTSCNKDDEPTPSKKTQLLTASTWKFSAVIGATDEINALYTAFLTNSTYTFRANKTYSITSIFGNGSGTWEFNSAETEIILDKGTADESRSEIVTLTESTLEIKETEDNVTFTIKYVK